MVWLKPSPVAFFNTLQAGELLYERMKRFYRASPTPAVLTCFHRVLLLGFRGRYQDPESDERQHLIAMFSKRVEPFRVQEDSAVLNVPLTGRQHYLWQSPFAGCYC